MGSIAWKVSYFRVGKQLSSCWLGMAQHRQLGEGFEDFQCWQINLV
jgi:hypothetical protein